MYQLKEVTQVYQKTTALEGLSFSVEPGAFVGIVGKSGSGKSTLLRLLNLMEKPTQGQIYFDQTEVTTLSKKARQTYQKKIGMVFQQYHLLSNQTVLENVLLPLKLIGKKETDYALSLLDFVGLSKKTQLYPSQLSGGEKQRVALARALVRKPDLLLCDEVTSALDEEYAEEVLILLQKIHREFPVTIFFVSHDLEAVKKVCHRVFVMEQGRLVGRLENQPAQLTKGQESYFEKVQRRFGG
ncbi:ATP-binding cassette domain-containing protein [Enterococcus sp. LJL98]